MPASSLPSSSTVRQGLESIDRSGLGVVVLLDLNGRLAGIATDGDIRRALLGGATLDSPLLPHANPNPAVCHATDSRAAIIDLMLARELELLPVVDDDSRVVGLHTVRGVLGRRQRENPVLILAGGRGRRLGPRTDDLPKPMLPVAGRPILERLVHHFVGYGFSEITLSVAYLAERIEEHFGDGSGFGCRIQYLRESPDSPRGTGGPFIDFVAGMHDGPTPVIVVNGDLVMDLPIDALVSDHETSGAQMTVATHIYAREVPFGVVHHGEDGWVSGIEEKPVVNVSVSAGVYVIDPELGRLIGGEGPIPMTDLISESLLRGHRVRACRFDSEWADVGRPSDLARARGAHDLA